MNNSSNVEKGTRNNNNTGVIERYLSKQGIATMNKRSSHFEQGAIVVLSKRSHKIVMLNKKSNNVKQEEQ